MPRSSIATERQPSPVAVGVVGHGVIDGTFACSGRPTGRRLPWFVAGLTAALRHDGFEERSVAGPEVQVVLHLVDEHRPRPYRRKAAPTFVVVIAELSEPPADQLRTGYPLLVRGLANLGIMLCETPSGPAAQFVTLEQGTYTVTHTGSDEVFFAAVVERIEPLATSQLVIANEFVEDLPPDLWNGDAETHSIARAGQRLAALDLLPAAFPIEEILSPRELRHVKLLYGIGGLSYGNLSAARRRPPTSSALGPEFWMSGSGVDKSNLGTVGRDVLLVKGYDVARELMVLSVPPGVNPNRVSVDAIEHWTIYKEHPDVEAIVHVHGWIEGTVATEINYPCGTVQLAHAVVELVRLAPDPAAAVVGQRNHGLTITGRSLDDIFERIEGKIVRNVPMD